MNTTLIVLGGIALLACAYCYHKNKQKQVETAVKPMTPEEALDALFKELEIEPEEVEQLSMVDVGSYFRGLHLRKEKDIPFIAQTTRDGRKMYLLATFNEVKNEVENYKLIAPNVVADDLTSVIREEKLVVLK